MRDCTPDQHKLETMVHFHIIRNKCIHIHEYVCLRLITFIKINSNYEVV